MFYYKIMKKNQLLFLNDRINKASLILLNEPFNNVNSRLFKHIKKDVVNSSYSASEELFEKVEIFISKHFNNQMLLNDLIFIIDLTNVALETTLQASDKSNKILKVIQLIESISLEYAIKTKTSQYLIAGFICSICGIIKDEKTFKLEIEPSTTYGKSTKNVKYQKKKKYTGFENYLIRTIKKRDKKPKAIDTDFQLDYPMYLLSNSPFRNKNNTLNVRARDKFIESLPYINFESNQIISESLPPKNNLIFIEEGVIEFVGNNQIFGFLEPLHFFYHPNHEEIEYIIRTTTSCSIRYFKLDSQIEMQFKTFLKKALMDNKQIIKKLETWDVQVDPEQKFNDLFNYNLNDPSIMKDYLLNLIPIPKIAQYLDLSVEETITLLEKKYPNKDIQFIYQFVR